MGVYQIKKAAEVQADKVRKRVASWAGQSKGQRLSFNDEGAVIVDQLHPPELNQQNVFYAEEKIIML
jgi:hypothetical protein